VLGYGLTLLRVKSNTTRAGQDEISLHEFEQFALDRMRVLKAIDAAKAKGMKADEMRENIEKLCAQYLPLRDNVLPGDLFAYLYTWL